MYIDPERVTPELTDKIRNTRVAPNPPADFVDFWSATAAELRHVPLNCDIVATVDVDPPPVSDGVTCAVWSADSFGGRRISGPVMFPRIPSRNAPVWVYSHGYGTITRGAAWRPDIAAAGFIALGVDIRGFARSRLTEDPAIPGWITHGIESTDHYMLRGAVADVIRAVEVARSLDGANSERTVLAGGSFGGGLAVLAAPWISGLTYIAVSTPTFGAYSLRRTLVKRGSGLEINAYAETTTHDTSVWERLAYFDSVNAAALIHDVAVTVGLGVSDVVVPGETVAAIYNALPTSNKHLLTYPCSHTSHPLRTKWNHFIEHTLQRAAVLCDV